MDLTTNYLGLELKHPLMLGASPFVDDLDEVRKAVDHGAAAIVLHSLFEEQLLQEEAAQSHLESYGLSFAEAASYLPAASDYVLGPDAYLKQVEEVKRIAGALPVIGSLNGVTPGGWLHYAKLIEEAGADALELNVYYVGSQLDEPAAAVEDRVVEMVRAVVAQTSLPVAVKLSPFYTSLPQFALRLKDAGAKGLVLFNRFYQPDIDIEALEVQQRLKLSNSQELLLRLRWLAMLSGRIPGVSLGCTGGVHTVEDALKAVMAGAHGVQLVSAVFQQGMSVFQKLRDGLDAWLTSHEYESLRQAQGSMSLLKSPNPQAYERGNYVKLLQGYARSMR